MRQDVSWTTCWWERGRRCGRATAPGSSAGPSWYCALCSYAPRAYAPMPHVSMLLCPTCLCSYATRAYAQMPYVSYGVVPSVGGSVCA
eukprot:1339575-Rhodomonas_salina.1